MKGNIVKIGKLGKMGKIGNISQNTPNKTRSPAKVVPTYLKRGDH